MGIALRRVLAQAEVLHDSGGRVAALYELGRLLEHQGLGTYEEIVATYRGILEGHPSDLGALLELERLAAQRGDRELLREVDALMAQASHDETVVAAHRARLAEALEGSEDTAAIEQFRAATQADPHHIGAARGLTRVAQETDDPHALVDALRREAEAERDPKAASELLVRSAFVRLQRIGDHDGARRDFEQALELWPDSEQAADGLIDVLTIDAAWSTLVDRLSQAASSAGSVERASALWLSVATHPKRAPGPRRGGDPNASARLEDPSTSSRCARAACRAFRSERSPGTRPRQRWNNCSRRHQITLA